MQKGIKSELLTLLCVFSQSYNNVLVTQVLACISTALILSLSICQVIPWSLGFTVTLTKMPLFTCVYLKSLWHKLESLAPRPFGTQGSCKFSNPCLNHKYKLINKTILSC